MDCRDFAGIAQGKFACDLGQSVSFCQALSTSHICRVLAQLKVTFRKRVFTPWVTLHTWIDQVLRADPSCRAALAGVSNDRDALRQAPISTNSSSYCTARQRLPQALLQRLLRDSGAEVHRQADPSWHWLGRRVKIVDGSTARMPDTPKNAAAFGKPSNQRQCPMFPVLRLVAVFCLATGAALDLALGPYRGKGTGELSLFRRLLDIFTRGDIMLGDRLYCSYLDIAGLLRRGVDVICRLHANRRADFRRGQRLGKRDHLVTWFKPKQRPDWLTPEEFAAMPDQLTIRELRVRVNRPGFRVRALTLATTLLDADVYSSAELATLYRWRWHAELDLRALKTVLHLDHLRCQSPDMVRKEAWIHFLAYNQLRGIHRAAAAKHHLTPRCLSFAAARQFFEEYRHRIVTSTGAELTRYCHRLLDLVAQHRVGHRPNRYEPRKVRSRPKTFPTLKRPRDLERKALAANPLAA